MLQFDLRKRLPLLFSAGLLAWMLVSVIRTGGLIASAYNPLPEMDAWEKVAHLDGYRQWPPRVLWEQHYEHRVLVPELALAFDWLFLKGRQWFPMVLSGLLDLGVWVVLALAAWRSQSTNNPPNALLLCSLFLAGIVMAWPGVAVVLSLPFLLQWLLYQFCATASLLAVAERRVGWAVALALVATYSSANGIFIWPLLLLVGFAAGVGRQKLALAALVGCLAASLYFVGYRNLGNSHPAVILTHPAKFFGYFLTYLGMPFGALGTTAGLAAGVVSLGLLGASAAMAWGTKEKSALVLLCLGLTALTLITALVTSVSRIPVDRPFEQAIITPGRYVNTGAHYWAVICVLTVWMANRWRAEAGWTAAVGLTGVLAATLPFTGIWVRSWMGQYANYQYATQAIEAGLRTSQMGEILNYADASLVLRSLPELEKRHLALYSWNRYRLVGRPLAELPPESRELPGNQVTSFTAISGGLLIVGWASPPARHLAVIDNTSATIVGLGRQLPAGLPVGVPASAGHEKDFWVAFAHSGLQANQLRIFILP